MATKVKTEITEELKKKIVKSYTEDEQTQRNVARRYGVSVNAVAAVLRENNIKPNTSRRF